MSSSNFLTWCHRQIFWRGFVSLVKFSYWSKFHVNIRDWPEIQKSEIPPSWFCPICGDWDKLEIPNLARMFLIKCYCMLQNASVTAFTVSELLRESQQGGKIIPSLTQIRVTGLMQTAVFKNRWIESMIFWKKKNCESFLF